MNILTISKTVGSSLTALGIVAMASAPAFAANVSVGGSNSITGANSSNDNSYSVYNDAMLSIDNLASSLNSLGLDLSNGGNVLSNNTTVGGFSSGDINAIGAFTTSLNTNPVLAMSAMDPSNTTGIFRNGTTGANSLNSNSLNVSNEQNTSITNLADINNAIGLDVSTGGNVVTDNTTVGPVSFGGANIGLSVNNSANRSAGSMLVPSYPSNVTVSGGNDTTGANSSNTNTVAVNNDQNTTVSNTSTITNTADISASTGGNVIDSNTTVGPIHTGGVTANLSFTNSAN